MGNKEICCRDLFTVFWWKVAQMVKNPPANANAGSIPGSGRCPGEGNGNLLQHPCLESHGQRSLAGYSMGSQRVRHDCATDAFPSGVIPRWVHPRAWPSRQGQCWSEWTTVPVCPQGAWAALGLPPAPSFWPQGGHGHCASTLVDGVKPAGFPLPLPPKLPTPEATDSRW